MINYKAVHLAIQMASLPWQIPGLSTKTVSALKESGMDTAGQVRDRLMSNQPIPGIGLKREDEIAEGLDMMGVGLWGSHYNSYTTTALASYDAGLAEGAAEKEREFLTQKLVFAVVDPRISVEKVKDKLLEAYGRRASFLAMRIIIKYDVPGIGNMAMGCDLGLSVDGVNTMLRAWNPAEPKKMISGDAVVSFNGPNARECDISIELLTFSGTMIAKPPDERAAERYREAFGTGR